MPDDTITQLVSRSSISFTGTVEQIGQASMAGVAIDDHTGVVAVDGVLHAPEALAKLAGSRVTVQFAPGEAPPEAGERLAFFANPSAFGESVAVIEVGRLPLSEIQANLSQAALDPTAMPLAGVEQSIRDAQLRAHSRDADAVVVGRVTHMEKAGPVTVSEHDPDWWVATIAVHHVERGSLEGPEVKVLFANSRDVRWHHTPKPRPGESGIWMVHATEGQLGEAAPYMIVHPEDANPSEHLDILRAED